MGRTAAKSLRTWMELCVPLEGWRHEAPTGSPHGTSRHGSATADFTDFNRMACPARVDRRPARYARRQATAGRCIQPEAWIRHGEVPPEFRLRCPDRGT